MLREELYHLLVQFRAFIAMTDDAFDAESVDLLLEVQAEIRVVDALAGPGSGGQRPARLAV
jgi:hypothetical protein